MSKKAEVVVSIDPEIYSRNRFGWRSSRFYKSLEASDLRTFYRKAAKEISSKHKIDVRLAWTRGTKMAAAGRHNKASVRAAHLLRDRARRAFRAGATNPI